MRRHRLHLRRLRNDARSIECLAVLLALVSGVALVACSSSGAGLSSSDAVSDSQQSPSQETEPAREDSVEAGGLGGLLDEADESTRWAVRCTGDRHCVYQRKIPVRDARADDSLIVQLDVDSPGRPDLLVIVAPRRAKESVGIKIAFLSEVADEAGDLPPFSSFPLRCLGTGCGAAVPLQTELNGGNKIADQLTSSRVLWVLYELDGMPTRSLIILEPLREAIDEIERAGASRVDPERGASRPTEQR